MTSIVRFVFFEIYQASLLVSSNRKITQLIITQEEFFWIVSVRKRRVSGILFVIRKTDVRTAAQTSWLCHEYLIFLITNDANRTKSVKHPTIFFEVAKKF